MEWYLLTVVYLCLATNGSSSADPPAGHYLRYTTGAILAVTESQCHSYAISTVLACYKTLLSILHFSTLLQVITVRIELPEARCELSQSRASNMQVALVLLYSKWGWQLVNMLGSEGENDG